MEIKRISCNRCGINIIDDSEETCWFCRAYLCFDCWEKVGHCGHIAAEKQNVMAAAFHAEFDKTGNKKTADKAAKDAGNAWSEGQ